MFFDNWYELLRIVVLAILAYSALVAILRISGARTLSKMNAFDLIVTVALGSTLATTILSRDVALVEALLAFVMLVGLQFVVTWLSVRSATFVNLVKSEPVLLVYEGQQLDGQMRRARVEEAAILQALRMQGIRSLDQVEAVVLETDGSFSVISKSDVPASVLRDLRLQAPH
ncbi:MAG: DUF421 domain-containing protein [Chloroflexota bacterium]|nr:DUF421 domain-containing protein [Chloroflexota bacterium]